MRHDTEHSLHVSVVRCLSSGFSEHCHDVFGRVWRLSGGDVFEALLTSEPLTRVAEGFILVQLVRVAHSEGE